MVALFAVVRTVCARCEKVRVSDVLFVHYIISVKNLPRLMPDDGHSNFFWHAGTGQIPDGGSAEVVKVASNACPLCARRSGSL